MGNLVLINLSTQHLNLLIFRSNSLFKLLVLSLKLVHLIFITLLNLMDFIIELLLKIFVLLLQIFNELLQIINIWAHFLLDWFIVRL